jgi:hypothetical protein
VNGKKCVSQDDILDGWAEHFETIFNMETYDENQICGKVSFSALLIVVTIFA